MKKKKLWFALGGLLLIAIVFGTVIKLREPKSIHSFYANQPEKVTKIEVMSGNNGKTESVTDINKIKQVTEYLETVRLEKVILEPSTGWTYRITIYEGDKEAVSITDKGEHYKIDGTDYKVMNKEKKALNELLGINL